MKQDSHFGWTQKGEHLIIFEVPLLRAMRGGVSQARNSDLIATLRRLLREEDTSFFSSKDLNVRLSDNDFLELSHLNYQGAIKFTEAFIKTILPEALELVG